MQSTETMNYLTVEQIEMRAVDQLRAAAKMAPGDRKSEAIKSAMQLRSYAAMKRLLAPSRVSPTANLNAPDVDG